MPTGPFLQKVERHGSKCDHSGNKTALDFTLGVWIQLPESSLHNSDLMVIEFCCDVQGTKHITEISHYLKIKGKYFLTKYFQTIGFQI